MRWDGAPLTCGIALFWLCLFLPMCSAAPQAKAETGLAAVVAGCKVSLDIAEGVDREAVKLGCKHALHALDVKYGTASDAGAEAGSAGATRAEITYPTQFGINTLLGAP